MEVFGTVAGAIALVETCLRYKDYYSHVKNAIPGNLSGCGTDVYTLYNGRCTDSNIFDVPTINTVKGGEAHSHFIGVQRRDAVGKQVEQTAFTSSSR